MIISSIVKREKININSKVNILWTPCEKEFEIFIQRLGHQLLSYNQTYYGNNSPHLIVCNDKVNYYNLCYNMSLQLHLPVLLIDHQIKNPLYDNTKIKMFDNFPCYNHICISKTISDSWGLNTTQILSYNSNDEDNINVWKNLIIQTTKKMFTI
jgi:hypothetical protein